MPKKKNVYRMNNRIKFVTIVLRAEVVHRTKKERKIKPKSHNKTKFKR